MSNESSLDELREKQNEEATLPKCKLNKTINKK